MCINLQYQFKLWKFELGTFTNDKNDGNYVVYSLKTHLNFENQNAPENA